MTLTSVPRPFLRRASLTIPAALRLIVYMYVPADVSILALMDPALNLNLAWTSYPEPDKQAIAIATFGGVGALSNM